MLDIFKVFYAVEFLIDGVICIFAARATVIRRFLGSRRGRLNRLKGITLLMQGQMAESMENNLVSVTHLQEAQVLMEHRHQERINRQLRSRRAELNVMRKGSKIKKAD